MTQLTSTKPDTPPAATPPSGASMASHHHRRRWMVIAIVVVLAVVAGFVGFRAWLTQAPARVSVGQAVDRYRSSTSDTTAPRPAAGAPSPGVYVYVTQGQETVDALGGDTHLYPPETTITITPTECGFRMSWMPLMGRSDTTDVCRSGGGLVVTTVENAHEFFHISQAEHFTWDAGSWWLPPSGVTQWTSTGHSDGSRITDRVGRVAGSENVQVGSEMRVAVHVRYDDSVTGASTGPSSTDLWLDPSTGLPLREMSTASTANDTIVGHVTFRETIDLRLVSTAPKT